VRIFCAALLAVAAPGCVSGYAGTARVADPAILDEPGWVAVRGVPVRLQESADDCGTAALAMVLGKYGEEASEIRVPSLRADAIRDAARGLHYESYSVPAHLEDLEAELKEGRPIVVGLVKPQWKGAVTHYEVVVGIDRAGGRIATHDPARGLTVNSIQGFDVEWSEANRVAVIIAPKESKPPGASR
jgi:ABC-type bacteriocin/lantibiotic exporter with double-glycine peptidase domain